MIELCLEYIILVYFFWSSFPKWIGSIFVFILSLVESAQLVVYYLTGDFISPLMLSNLFEYEALGFSYLKHALTYYMLFFVALVTASFLLRKLKNLKLSLFFIVIYLIFFYLLPLPLKKIFTAVNEYKKQYFFHPIKDAMQKSKKLVYHDFACVEKCKTPFNYPIKNVIVIFTEGLSSVVIDQFNSLQLGLTKNIDNMIAQSVYVDNYYNHTAATYRGLRGQLISSYQYRDGFLPDLSFGFDQNMTLEMVDKVFADNSISLAKVLSNYNYDTYFISSTSTQSKLNRLLKTLDFTEVYGMEDFNLAQGERMADDQTFSALIQFLKKKEKNSKKSFFLAIYPSGTHHGMQKNQVNYADGANQYYNKFYNYDKQFGRFFDVFKQSFLSKTTLLILTSDHATFSTPEYRTSFSTQEPYFVDKIPLAFYFNGLKPMRIDAQGKNSLSLAPTILNILGFKYKDSWFLGCSLFDKKCKSSLNTITAIGGELYDTQDNKVVPIEDELVKKSITEIYQATG